MTRRARLADTAAQGYPQRNPFAGAEAPHGSGRFEDEVTYADGNVMGILVVQVKESGIFDLASWFTFTLTSGSDANFSLALVTGTFTVDGNPPAAGFYEFPEVVGGTQDILGRAYSPAASGEKDTIAMSDQTTTGAARDAFVGFEIIAHVTGEGAGITVDGTVSPAGSIAVTELS